MSAQSSHLNFTDCDAGGCASEPPVTVQGISNMIDCGTGFYLESMTISPSGGMGMVCARVPEKDHSIDALAAVIVVFGAFVIVLGLRVCMLLEHIRGGKAPTP